MFFGEVPPEVQRQLEKQMAHHQMHEDSYQHEVVNFIRGLDESGLRTLKGMITGIDQSETQGVLLIGYILSQLEARYSLCFACGKDHEAMLTDLSGQKEPKVIKKNVHWSEFVKSLPAGIIARLEEYHLDLIPDQWPVVACNKCGLEYQSLEDRMVKAPDECHGCQQKAAWG